VISKSVFIPERGAVPGLLLINGTNRYSLLLPADWRVGSDISERKVTRQSRDFSGTITLTLASGTNGTSFSKEAVRDQLSRQYPEGKITREFVCTAMGQRGAGFDLELPAGSNAVAMRINSFPTIDGSIEFALTAMSEQITNYYLPFAMVMTSFQSQQESPKK